MRTHVPGTLTRFAIQVAIRNIRREAVDTVKKAEKAKKLGKDQVRRRFRQKGRTPKKRWCTCCVVTSVTRGRRAIRSECCVLAFCALLFRGDRPTVYVVGYVLRFFLCGDRPTVYIVCYVLRFVLCGDRPTVYVMLFATYCVFYCVLWLFVAAVVIPGVIVAATVVILSLCYGRRYKRMNC